MTTRKKAQAAADKAQRQNAPINFVAKHSRTFNISKVEIDRKKANKRGETKHKPQWC
jgi:hypothetical protein